MGMQLQVPHFEFRQRPKLRQLDQFRDQIMAGDRIVAKPTLQLRLSGYK